MFGFPRDTAARRPAAPLGRVEALEDRITPVINVNNDFYSAALGTVLTVPASKGVLANDFSDINPGQALSATLVSGPRYVGSNTPLPATPGRGSTGPSLFLNPDGSFTFIAPSAEQIPLGVTQVQFTYTVTNLSTPGETTTGPATVTINLQSQAQNLIAVGADAPGGPHVRVYESGSGILRYNFFPYEQSFTGGVRVAAGDVTGDGVDDIITVPATGGSTRLRVFDGSDGLPIADQFQFDPNFRGGGYVAVGDFNGNGTNDIIVGAGDGGGPRVQVLEFVGGAAPLTQIADFYAFDPTAGQFGVRVAAGDLNNAGRDFIVAAAGVGGGPEVRVFDGNQVLRRQAPNIASPAARAFFAGDTAGRTGVYVAVGDFTGTGSEDIVTGTGSGTPIVRIYDGGSGAMLREFRVPGEETPTGGGISGGGPGGGLLTQTAPSGTLLSPTIVPGSLVQASVGTGLSGSTLTGGARVAATDYNGDGVDDIVVGAGPGSPPRVRIFNGVTQAEIINLLAFSGSFLGGVNVGAE